MDEDGATLSVGFAIDTGGAFAELLRFTQMFDDKTVQFVRQAAQIEKATGGMVALGRATADVRAFGVESTRALQSASREAANAERAGERLVSQLQRQNDVFGKTREQLRSMRTEEAALAAERSGNSDLALRLRQQEQALYDQEFAAARRAEQAAEDIAETKQRAAEESIAAAQREAESVRLASEAYRTFEAVAKQRLATYREQQAAEEALAASAARAAAADQARIDGEQRMIAQMTERSRLEAALARIDGSDRPSATQSGASFSALAGQAEEENRLAAAAERLRAAIDPAYAAQQRFNSEIAQARELVSTGSISLDEYCAKLRIEQGQLSETGKAQLDAGHSANAHRYALMDLSYQLQDIGASMSTVSGPSGVIRIFAQQGGQLFDALNRIAMASGGAGKAIGAAGEESHDAGADIDGLGERVTGVAEKAEGMGGKFGKFAGFLAGPWGAALR